MLGTNEQEGFSVQHIGARLKVWRQHHGQRGYQVAKTLGISAGSYSEIERGLSAPSAKTLYAIALHTGINLHWLLTGRGEAAASVTPQPASEGTPGTKDLLQRIELLESRLAAGHHPPEEEGGL
ncbi:helix-turn-helix domain-containing protein [Nitrospina gracilis]|uniref:helix-turn-helix domain-containing protein n=1 Tax=Nitrospina gracilis TaxID=35801 RepID=UPI001F392C59|nr:helix-turn-helix transcriptional regulator [Nitrospina gracilis]MCF8719246.1 transcriptional regulator with XRE-family HTH domain [Nitrospina gracilis Nb-211]